MGATDDKIRISCAGCGVRLALPAATVGRTARCPKCKTPVTIPAPELPVMELDDAPLSREPATPAMPPDEPVQRKQPLQVDVTEEPPPDFSTALNKVWLYPVSNLCGKAFLVITASMWTLLRGFVGTADILMMAIMIVSMILLAGYVSAFMWQILFDTATHKPETPRFPDITHPDELLLHCARFFGATLLAFLPAIAVAAIGFAFDEGTGGRVAAWIAAGLLCLFGVITYPMTLMMIGFGDSLWTSCNYLLAVKGIFKTLPNYSVCALYFVGTFIAASILESQLVAALSGDQFPYLVAILLTTFIELYLMLIQMRALGFLYLCNKERLDWFR